MPGEFVKNTDLKSDQLTCLKFYNDLPLYEPREDNVSFLCQLSAGPHNVSWVAKHDTVVRFVSDTKRFGYWMGVVMGKLKRDKTGSLTLEHAGMQIVQLKQDDLKKKLANLAKRQRVKQAHEKPVKSEQKPTQQPAPNPAKVKQSSRVAKETRTSVKKVKRTRFALIGPISMRKVKVSARHVVVKRVRFSESEPVPHVRGRKRWNVFINKQFCRYVTKKRETVLIGSCPESPCVPPPPKLPRSEFGQECYKLMQQGKTDEEIAKILNKSPNLVWVSLFGFR